MDTGDLSYLGAYFLFMKNRTFPCPSPSANLVGVWEKQEGMSHILLLPVFRHLLCPESGKQTYTNQPFLQFTKLFYDFSRFAKITQDA